MSARAAAYQEDVTGLPAGTAYVVNGVKFDGYRNGALIEAKGPGYAWAVNSTGEFRSDFQGAVQLLGQAGRQIKAAPQGTPIVWYVAEERAQRAIITLLSKNGFEGINVVYRPGP
jgi:hypothetical protein